MKTKKKKRERKKKTKDSFDEFLKMRFKGSGQKTNAVEEIDVTL